MSGSQHEISATDRSTGVPERHEIWSGTSLAGLALIGVVFFLLAALTWRKWPDPIIDFGTQLYIPWRMTEGAVLYRDLFYFAGGPLSQYFNALLFKLFGVSFTTLIVANLTFSVLLLWFVYRRFLAASDVLTATMIGLGIVVVFAFSEYLSMGNYNFIAPYSHETVHGLLLSLLAIGLLADWLARPRWQSPLLAGLCAGLVFLTKPDIFLALMACCAATLALHWHNGGKLPVAMKSAGLFGLTMIAPPLFFFLFFLRVEDWLTSLRSVVFGWLPLFQPEVRNNPFYVRFRGMDQPLMHLRVMANHFLSAVLVIVLYAILFRGLGRWKAGRNHWRWVVWLVLVLPLLQWALIFRWIHCGSSLPLWCLTALVLLGWQLKKSPGSKQFVFLFLWTIFALLIMSKLGVDARIWHCGFALAMPAFVITLYLLLSLLPSLLETRYQVPGKYLRAMFTLILLAAFYLLFHYSEGWYQYKRQSIGHGGDKILVFGPSVAYGDCAKLALDWVEKNVPANGTLAVLPSGVTLNYLSRRVNPTPCLFWDPNSMAIWGQAAMTSRFEATPPDYILLVEQDQSEFGVGYFGSYPGYGVNLMQWIKQNYKVAVLYGDEPLRHGGFGIEILQRLAPATDRNSATIRPHSSEDIDTKP